MARICQRLDGIPLALELAAARVKLLTAEQVAARLDDALGLLTGGSPTALPRHRTLQATIRWSYELLTGRSGSCWGGCRSSPAAAPWLPPRRCARATGLPAGQMLDGLTALVDKILVIADRQSDQDTRYRLLEMVRQFAAEKLEAAGDTTARRNQHRDYYAECAQSVIGKYRAANPRPTIEQFEPELENLRLALGWSLSEPGAASAPEAGPRLICSVWPLLPTVQEQLSWARRAMVFCQGRTDIAPAVYGRVLSDASSFMAWNDLPTALIWLKQAIEIGRQFGPKDFLIQTLCLLGDRYGNLSNMEQAMPAYAEAEALSLELWPEAEAPEKYWQERAAWTGRHAAWAYGQGQYASAKALALESIRLLAGVDDGLGFYFTRVTLGDACRRLGEFDEARAIFRDLLQSGNKYSGDWAHNRRGHSWLALGWVELSAGDLDLALDCGRQSLEHANRIPDYNIMSRTLGLLASVAAQQGQPLRAATLAGASHAMYARQGRKPVEDTSLDTADAGLAHRAGRGGYRQRV